jgi:putative ABC transport system substrate-binding protein
LAYGPRFEQVYRQRARIVVKLLRGAKAAETPVEQPSVFELVVNLQTAKSIGHQVPETLIDRVDKVIE